MYHLCPTTSLGPRSPERRDGRRDRTAGDHYFLAAGCPHERGEGVTDVRQWATDIRRTEVNIVAFARWRGACFRREQHTPEVARAKFLDPLFSRLFPHKPMV